MLNHFMEQDQFNAKLNFWQYNYYIIQNFGHKIIKIAFGEFRQKLSEFRQFGECVTNHRLNVQTLARVKKSFEMYGVESKSVQSEFCIILYFQLVQNGKIELSDGRYSYDQIHLNNSIRSLRSFSCML